MIDDAAARRLALDAGQEQAEHLQQESLCFADMTTLVKQHRLVMKVAEIRASVHLLQPIEADGKTFVSQISIENEEGGFAQRGAGQGNALGGSVLGVLSLDSLDRLEPQLPPRLDEHGFILRLNTFLPGQSEVSFVFAAQKVVQKIQCNGSVGHHGAASPTFPAECGGTISTGSQ